MKKAPLKRNVCAVELSYKVDACLLATMQKSEEEKIEEKVEKGNALIE